MDCTGRELEPDAQKEERRKEERSQEQGARSKEKEENMSNRTSYKLFPEAVIMPADGMVDWANFASAGILWSKDSHSHPAWGVEDVGSKIAMALPRLRHVAIWYVQM